jgi:hypothetical protein
VIEHSVQWWNESGRIREVVDTGHSRCFQVILSGGPEENYEKPQSGSQSLSKISNLAPPE